jgi:hypothetical protein
MHVDRRRPLTEGTIESHCAELTGDGDAKELLRKGLNVMNYKALFGVRVIRKGQVDSFSVVTSTMPGCPEAVFGRGSVKKSFFFFFT